MSFSSTAPSDSSFASALPSRTSSGTSLSSSSLSLQSFRLQRQSQTQNESDRINYADSILSREIQALITLRSSLRDPTQSNAFLKVVQVISEVGMGGGKVVCSGVGKSFIVAKKSSATLSSLGVPATTLHPTDAMHGDLGLVSPQDVLILFSHSGSTTELSRMIVHVPPTVQRVVVTSSIDSSLANLADGLVLIIPPDEADEEIPAPTASVLCMCAVMDAVSLAVLKEREGEKGRKKLGELHPGGRLGEVCRDNS